ncbi:MAG: adenine phosphoribosyltransferase [Bdellovibrio sp.]|nr:adenine phosphoribosyltransferase [Bdellovibrio sp.]
MPIRSKIRTIPNYPKPGIMFRDITTLLKDREGFAMAIDQLCARYNDKKLDVIAGIEARGFIIGAAMAVRMKLGFVPIRKKGKLPGPTVGVSYKLEYGEDHIEIHKDAIQRGERVLLVDDLIATGGTALGAAKLIRQIGGELVEACFIVDLPELKGGDKLREQGIPYFSLVDFEGE